MPVSTNEIKMFEFYGGQKQNWRYPHSAVEVLTLEQDYNLTEGAHIMKVAISLSILCFGILASVGALADKDERGGTCEDAKQQYRYFCDKEGFKDDIMLNAPIACNNAKRNMKAACEGISEEDYSYQFEEGTPKR